VIENQLRTRRSIIGAGVGALIGGLASVLGRPLPAAATVKTMQTGTDNAADAETRLYRTNDGVVFSAFSPTMPAFQTTQEVIAIGSNVDSGIGIRSWVTGSSAYAFRGVSEGADSTAVEGVANGANSTGVEGLGTSFGVYGESPLYGVGGRGSGAGSIAVFGYADAAGAIGVKGTTNNGATSVVGTAFNGGTAAAFSSDTGLALDITGMVRLNRAGRASVAANASSVDVTVPGGLGTSSFILATLQGNHPGVAVSSVRLNYPSAGKARIYLNKVASTTGSTPVGWIAIR